MTLLRLRDTPVVNVTVIVPVAALVLTAFAPTVSATENVAVDVPVASLALAGLAPLIGAPQSIVVPVSSLAFTAYAPSIPGGAPLGLVFASEWDTATGTTTAAIQDTGRTRPWTFDEGGEVRVTATDGRDFPTTNYLRIRGQDGHIHFEVGDGYIPALAVGDSLSVRYYFRPNLPNSENATDPDNHGIYFDDSIGGVNWGPQTMGWYSQWGTDTCQPWLSLGSDQDLQRYWWPASGSLSKLTTYRIEALYTRTATDAYTARYQIYSIAGTLLYDSPDMVDIAEPTPTTTLDAYTASSTGAAAAGMRGFRIGYEASLYTSGTNFYEIAGVAICAGATASVAWPIGPYVAAEAAFTT